MSLRKKIFNALALCCVFLFFGNLEAQQITGKYKDTPIKDVLKDIENQTDYSVIYDVAILKQAKNVTTEFIQTPLESVLKNILGNNLGYSLKGEIISIFEKNKKGKKKLKNISGKVVDSKGNPVIGAELYIPSTGKTINADFDGAFIIDEIPEFSTIIVSEMGHEPKEIKASKESIKKITLETAKEMSEEQRELAELFSKKDTVQLNDIVVVGYGTQKRENLTGAVSTISGKELNQRPVNSAATALQGVDPSVNISLNSGSPSSGYKINIRGVMSVNGGNPLIIIDGVESSLTQLNPNDIETISVLKDASAASIYGAKASSGVILVTTKSGNNKGKTNISYDYRYGYTQNTTSQDFIRNGYDHTDIVNKFYRVYKGVDMFKFNDEQRKMLEDRRFHSVEDSNYPWVVASDDGKYYYFGNFDWYNYLYRKTRPQQEHNLSVSGGNKKLNYYTSARFFKQEGIFNIYPDEYNNLSFRTKVNSELMSWLKLTTNVSYNINRYEYGGDRKEGKTLESLQSNINSVFMPRNPDGTIVLYNNQMNANSPLGAGYAGLLTADKNRNSRRYKQLAISNQLDATLFKGFVLTAQYSYRNYTKLNKYRNVPFLYSKKQGVEQLFSSGSIFNEYTEYVYDEDLNTINVYGTYNKTFGRSHNLKAVAGTQYETFRSVGNSMNQTGLLSDDFSTFAVATGDSKITQSIGTYRTLGYFGRLNYDYNGKYLAEFSARYDGSSRFAPEDRWGLFPSFSLGWRLSKEDFWKPLSGFWNNAKLRFSYGSLGNQQVSLYSYMDLISSDKIMDYTFDGKTKANYAVVSDPISSSLTWETVSTYNYGLDASFLRNRLTLTADVFSRYTTDMLVPGLTLPKVFGAKTPKENAADLKTNGWEIVLSWNDKFLLSDKPFNYSVTATLGDYITKITRFNNPNKLISDYYEGQTLGEIWGYKSDGLFKTNEEAAQYQSRINDKSVNSRVYSSKIDGKLMAGDVRFVDINGDGIISQGAGTVDNPGDQVIIGNSTPRYNYSFRFSGDWNNFDFSVFFQGIGKRDWFPGDKAYDFWGPYSFPSLSFIHKDFMSNVWSEDNPNAYFPRPRGYQTYGGGALRTKTDRYIQNVAYLRLKNVSIGYQIPVFKETFNQVRLYFVGENLFYWSPLKKYSKTIDPESTYSSNGLQYAYSKTFSLGLNLKF
ncbi:SusC/RagA family TonB-linked outer membrane protein [Ornithobacterium rhinotracheale]|uniref:SusC/RagA family TonB-linked outer membrane protein n=1 Tax=Ornithobacterium rhinotracheale TaxID=28251 RepID=UPI0040365AAA